MKFWFRSVQIPSWLWFEVLRKPKIRITDKHTSQGNRKRTDEQSHPEKFDIFNKKIRLLKIKFELLSSRPQELKRSLPSSSHFHRAIFRWSPQEVTFNNISYSNPALYLSNTWVIQKTCNRRNTVWTELSCATWQTTNERTFKNFHLKWLFFIWFWLWNDPAK